ncbi:MAG TPA: hypothetical protein VNE71_11015 [Myxococcota bacterium]|nr:hypothetical protein [Myxococcota bacterium]
MASPLDTSPDGGSTHRAAGALEWTLFGVLCVTVVAYWSLQYQPFVLPNNDYASFQDTARSLAALELPRHFQRMPLFPALMGIVAPLLPCEQPYLQAALAVNAACSLGLLVLVFVFGARAFGRGALLPPLLLASTTQFHSMALQPLVEPSLAFFVALAFVLFQARSPWQYAAAFAAGLGRYEAVILIPVLFVGNLAVDRRFFTHAGLAALAASGFVGWTALGWLHGSGGATYYDLMAGMGFRAAPDFFERSFKEPFRGWYREPGDGLWIFLLAIGIPLAAGVRAGLAEFRREAAAIAAFFVLCVAVIVIFGINKARYVFPTEWIPIFFFALGALRLTEAAERALERAPRALGAAVALAAGLALAFVARRRGLQILATEGAQPAALDAAFFAALLALSALALALWSRHRPRIPAAAAALVLLALLTPQIAGGVHAKRKELFKVMYENWGSYVAAQWLKEHLGPEERAVVVSPNHVEHLTGLGEDRVSGYASLRASNLEDLREEMRARGIRYALYTWRKAPETPSDAYYHKRLKAFLSEEFRSGGTIPGFEHVATLPLPPELERDPVQVYRVAEEGD